MNGYQFDHLLLVQIVVRTDIIRNLEAFHLVDFRPADLVGILDGTFAEFLVHDCNVNRLLNGLVLGRYLQKIVSLVGILGSSCQGVSLELTY